MQACVAEYIVKKHDIERCVCMYSVHFIFQLLMPKYMHLKRFNTHFYVFSGDCTCTDKIF